MKRFIRTEDGEIIDRLNQKAKEYDRYIDVCNHIVFKIDIVKQADTIEELIEVGDLVKFGGTGSHTFVSALRDKTTFYDYYGAIKDKQYIIELYTKQGNDFILVAKKENGKWRVI